MFCDHMQDKNADAATKTGAGGDKKLIINFIWPFKNVKYPEVIHFHSDLTIKSL